MHTGGQDILSRLCVYMGFFLPYLFGALLLFHTVSDNNVNNFPPEPLNYSLEAALLPCGEVDSGRLLMQPSAEIPH